MITSERMQGQGDKYQIRHLTVRSRSEAIAAKKLKNAVRTSAVQGWVDETVFEELKITNPAYFEVYRNEAVAAYYASDVPRAIQSYEAALEYGRDEAQLHYFFAGLLMRSGYFERAAAEYESALKLDPNEPVVLREAARNLFRLHKYDEARAHLNQATLERSKTQKDAIVLLDLQIQLRVRLIEYKTRLGDLDKAVEGCVDLLQYLAGCDSRLFDRKIHGHISAVFGPLAQIRRDDRRDNTEIDELSAWINANVTVDRHFTPIEPQDGSRVGFLKKYGRKPTFGFIVDTDQKEFFVAAAIIDPDIWQWLNEDGAILFKPETNEKGPIATNLVKYND